MFDFGQDSIVYQEAIPYNCEKYFSSNRERYGYGRDSEKYGYGRGSCSPARSYSNTRSRRRSPDSPSRMRHRSSSRSKNSNRVTFEQTYSHTHRDYYLHVYYSSKYLTGI
ncbi:hypothetical protein Phum_PHUM029780 [Pediculus humanus corporis]|uniref:Uncharacterized protein n=1 Tax=Pediculus humanus subsp. corporis TaxID=121224 RepID=E0VA78_PEDHC|nr:uncharacterized protein Phum_PHUM029780 [Pediculus humanus corporis]EEB10284.1 hypothetical protein Phum_PHUM029780 [Pediculus humanus corporis]